MHSPRSEEIMSAFTIFSYLNIFHCLADVLREFNLGQWLSLISLKMEFPYPFGLFVAFDGFQ